MDFVTEFGLFAAKLLALLVFAWALIGGVMGVLKQRERPSEDRLEIKRLNDKYDAMLVKLRAATLPRKEHRRWLRQHHKQRRRGPDGRKKVFVLRFQGDMRAAAVASLREEITALLMVAQPTDEVVLLLESPGGVVHGYGLAASQLQRLRDRQVPLTVIVDKVAASGGYLMACVANRLIAAPFAVVGSIGVIGQLPNFNRLLKNHDIDFEMVTAGDYKRTLTMFGENTAKGREKFQAELEEVHALFKDFVSRYRPAMDIQRVATGEHWYGSQALGLQLIDAVQTSDDYLHALSTEADVFDVRYTRRKHWFERLFGTR